MPKQIIIAEQHRIAAVFSEDQIQELIVATGTHQVGDIYLGVVENVLPGIDAAFVNIGDADRNGFIHVSDLGPLRLRRTAASITELLAPQQKVLVQVMKEPTGTKGPRLTGNISLPGRYLVLMPYGKGVNLSRRIRHDNERNRLRALAILMKPAGMGVVIRTEAEGMPEEAIIEDLEALQRQWENVLQEASATRAPALLNRDDDFIQRVLRDVFSADVNRIVVDSHTGLKRVKQHLMNWGSGKMLQSVLIDHHRDRIPVLEYFRINAAIREALKPRVDLPSGGYIIIERTEALTVIDVNSGSFTRSATARETVLWTNCEAATEIARQLRLRNIAGVIIVDFIDMDSRRDQLQVLEHFNKALKADKARPQIAQLSELGLVELTRKRQGKNIYELFSRPCATCGGLGHIVHLAGEPVEEDNEPGDFVGTITPRESRSDNRGRVRENREAQLADVTLPNSLFWDDRSSEPGDAGDAQDLANHPSYQELGANNRRRRRRRIGDEPGRERVKGSWDEERGGSSASSNSGIPIDVNGTGTADEPGDVPTVEMPRRARGRRAPVSREARVLETREPEVSEVAANVDAETTEVAAPADERRTRSRRDGGRTTMPPEVIQVEMTPEEQEVYAWMGVSPLILSSQEVKNPKSTVISVVLPGQASLERSSDSEPLEAERTSYDSADDSVTEPVAQSDSATVDAASTVSDSPEVADSVPTVAENELTDGLEPDAAVESSDKPEPPRRRRRRSSALATET